MKYLLWSALIALFPLSVQSTKAQEVTLIGPGGIKCALDRITPDFEHKSGYTLKATIGAGGATHQQVVRGEAFDVPIVQAPYQDVLDSGNVVASSETPLGTIALVVLLRKGDPKPDISTPDAVKRMLLNAKAISYPDGAGGRGGAAGVSFDETQKKLGIYDQVQPKVKRTPGVALTKLLTNGDIDLAVTFVSEVNDPGVQIVGPLPTEISTPTSFVAFLSSHAKSPEAANALLKYFASPDAAAAYKACAMQPGR